MKDKSRAAMPVLAAAVLAACEVTPKPPPAAGATGFLFKSVTIADQHLDYAVYIPRTYDPRTPSPAILFLHGSGESGTDGQKMIAQGIGTNILWNAARWPCIVIMPQKPAEKRQWEDYDALVMAALETTRREYSVDPRHIALTGNSQGGHGTWTLGAAHPEVWSALVPICGYPEPADPAVLADRIRSIPVWCFHGETDNVVPPAKSQVMIDALHKAGASPKFTLYPGVNHGSWDKAYAEPELPGWMMAQTAAAK